MRVNMEKRLIRSELELVRRFAAFLSELLYIRDDMKPRISMLENGPERLEKILDDSSVLIKEILATAPEKQRQQIARSLQDYKIQLVPLFTPGDDRVVMKRDQAEELVNMAQERCRDCVMTHSEAESCKLYQWLIANVPTDQEGSEFICPYSLASWG